MALLECMSRVTGTGTRHCSICVLTALCTKCTKCTAVLSQQASGGKRGPVGMEQTNGHPGKRSRAGAAASNAMNRSRAGLPPCGGGSGSYSPPETPAPGPETLKLPRRETERQAKTDGCVGAIGSHWCTPISASCGCLPAETWDGHDDQSIQNTSFSFWCACCAGAGDAHMAAAPSGDKPMTPSPSAPGNTSDLQRHGNVSLCSC